MKVIGTIKEYVRSKVTDLYASKITEYDKLTTRLSRR